MSDNHKNMMEFIIFKMKGTRNWKGELRWENEIMLNGNMKCNT